MPKYSGALEEVSYLQAIEKFCK